MEDMVDALQVQKNKVCNNGGQSNLKEKDDWKEDN